MTKIIQTIQIATFALLLSVSAHAAPGMLVSDRAASAESTGILIVGKAAPVERSGLLLSDRAAPPAATERAGVLMGD